jgi:hypothetical protein
MQEAGKFEENIVESEAKFGRNIKAVIEFSRHEVPGKITEGPKAGMSADFITSEGRDRAAAKGKTIGEKAVKDYSSPKIRAQETGDLGLQNVEQDVRVINQKLGEKFSGVVEGQKPENEFIMRLRPELDTVKSFEKIMPQAKSWAQEQIKQGSKGTEMDYIIQYYLDHQAECAELGVTTPEEAAQEIAYAAQHEMDMTERFYNDSEVRLRNFTHGPKLEPFLQRVIIREEGKKGFEKLEEIGGSFNPGESFKFLTERDGAGNLNVKMIFRDKEYSVDLEEMENLASGYAKRQEKK